MSNQLNERIAALRKERGLTQEQLGQMVGVSAQAVSKWEKGGAPDVELLPVLAERLGVTIDALFGLEAGERLDVEDVVGRWLLTIPKEQRLDRFCRMFWSAFRYLVNEEVGLSVANATYLESCGNDKEGGGLMCSIARTGGGIMLDLHAEDLSFVTLWPEPKAGYAAYFAPKSEYRSFFQLLARPGCLELLELIYTRKQTLFVPAVISKQLHMPSETVRELLDALVERSILWSATLEQEDGEVQAYSLNERASFVPFLYMARCFMQESRTSHVNIWPDGSPLLRGGAWKDEKEEQKHEK